MVPGGSLEVGMRCPLTEDWVSPDPTPVNKVLARLQRNANARRRYAEGKAEEFMDEREAQANRRVMRPSRHPAGGPSHARAISSGLVSLNDI
jgi:hypothetical protein